MCNIIATCQIQFSQCHLSDISSACGFFRSSFMKYLVRSWSWRCLIKTLIKMTFSEGISMGYWHMWTQYWIWYSYMNIWKTLKYICCVKYLEFQNNFHHEQKMLFPCCFSCNKYCDVCLVKAEVLRHTMKIIEYEFKLSSWWVCKRLTFCRFLDLFQNEVGFRYC